MATIRIGCVSLYVASGFHVAVPLGCINMRSTEDESKETTPFAFHHCGRIGKVEKCAGALRKGSSDKTFSLERRCQAGAEQHRRSAFRFPTQDSDADDHNLRRLHDGDRHEHSRTRNIEKTAGRGSLEMKRRINGTISTRLREGAIAQKLQQNL